MSSRVRRSPRPLASLAAALLCATLLASCGSENDDTATDAGAEPSETAASEPAAGAACEYVEDGMPAAKEVEPPPGQPAATGPVSVELATSAGTINAELDGATTPCTVNSFLSLAEQGY